MLAGMFCLAAAACSPVVTTHGADPDMFIVDGFTVGQSNRQDVFDAFGSPLTDGQFGVFNSDIWYYMYARHETLAFLAPKIVYRRIVAFDFDAQNIVENIATYTEEDGKDIEMVSRITPTRGNDTNIFKELFGNVGRFVEQTPDSAGP